MFEMYIEMELVQADALEFGPLTNIYFFIYTEV
jgi:hypothetical protein